VAKDKYVRKKNIALVVMPCSGCEETVRMHGKCLYGDKFSLVYERECNCPPGISSSLRFGHKKRLFISTTTNLPKVTLSEVLSRVQLLKWQWMRVIQVALP
jgi:hypothetical protein